jgi:hypothetical protein
MPAYQHLIEQNEGHCTVYYSGMPQWTSWNIYNFIKYNF